MIPDHLKPLSGIIVNTHTSTKPGEHWIAIYNDVNEIKVFDPIGIYYPTMLRQKLESMNRKIKYNHEQYQDIWTTTCGSYCLLWLYLQTL